MTSWLPKGRMPTNTIPRCNMTKISRHVSNGECVLLGNTHLSNLGLPRLRRPYTFASHGRSACVLISPRLTGRATTRQLWEECMHTHITTAGRTNEANTRQLQEECMRTHITTTGRTNEANTRQPWEECMHTHITATGRTGQQLPAAGGVHAHSRHRDWQDGPTIASRGRSACALTSPRLAGRANGCQQREECMCTRTTVAGRENKPEKKDGISGHANE